MSYGYEIIGETFTHTEYRVVNFWLMEHLNKWVAKRPDKRKRMDGSKICRYLRSRVTRLNMRYGEIKRVKKYYPRYKKII